MKWIDVISKGVLPLLSPGFILLFSFTANDNDLQMEEGMSFTIGLCVY